MFAFVWEHENRKPHVSRITNSLCRQGQHLQGGWRKSDADSEEHCREGWSETNREGKDEKIGKVKINRESGWGVLYDAERWSWGTRRKGRPFRGRRNTQLD